ncbi:FHA domain-containing protein [bacterium]|nr:FHA domain-containing protein [bacterium]
MKRCPKCGARNADESVTCNLCNWRMNEVVDVAGTFEPRLWKEGKQRNRGEINRAPQNFYPGSASAGAQTPTPAPASDADLNTERHFLVPPLGDPIKLDIAKTSFVFGRDAACQIRIPSTKVSRRHAEIRWAIQGDQRACLLRDLNSQNGTYVNDVKLTTEHVLDDNDSIRLGDFVTMYRKLAPGDDTSNLIKEMSDTDILDTVRLENVTAGIAGNLSGDASVLPINEVLRRLLSLHAYGTLNVEVGGAKGAMRIVDGRAVDGGYAGLEGMAAIRAMAALTTGRFRFDVDPNAPKPAARAGALTERFEPPPRPTQSWGAPPKAGPPPALAPGFGNAPGGPAPGAPQPPAPRPAAPPRQGPGTAPIRPRPPTNPPGPAPQSPG